MLDLISCILSFRVHVKLYYRIVSYRIVSSYGQFRRHLRHFFFGHNAHGAVRPVLTETLLLTYLLTPAVERLTQQIRRIKNPQMHVRAEWHFKAWDWINIPSGGSVVVNSRGWYVIQSCG